MRRARLCPLRGMAEGVHGRASARRRLGLCRAMAVLAALILLSVPVVADAKPLTDMQTGSLDTRIYTVSVENQGGLDVTSKYSAACWMCGINPNELDSEMRTELSNSGSGGRFFDFAQQFQQYYLNPTQAETLGLNAAFMAKILLWGDSWGFWRTGALDKTLYSGAMTDLAKVMRGESLGGGSSVTGDDLTFTLPVRYNAATNGGSELRFRGTDGKYYSSWLRKSGDEYVSARDAILPNTIVVNLHNVTYMDGSQQVTPSDTGITSGAIRVRTPSVDRLDVSLVLGNGFVSEVALNNSVYGGMYYSSVDFEVPFGDRRCYAYNTNNYWSDQFTVSSYQYSGGVLDITLSENEILRKFTAGSSQNLSPNSSFFTLESQFGILGTQSVTPPVNNWPDDGDGEPTPGTPDVPSPGDDPVSPPDVPGITDDPIRVPTPGSNQPEPTGTTPQDYTPWLRAILLQLHSMTNSLRDTFMLIFMQFPTHCNHIRQTIASYGQYLADVIKYELYTLKLYLEDLAEWLAEQLKFDVSGGGFDDSTVIRWLKEIFYKDSTLNFREASELPGSLDVNGALSWWDALIDGLIGDFGEDFSTGLETYVSLINGVIGKWPYSVPYDARNVFNLIVRVPVAPAFDVTLPAIVGWWDAVTFRVDLSPFSGAASACRSMFLVMWAIILIKQTGWLMGVLEHGVSFLDDFFRG